MLKPTTFTGNEIKSGLWSCTICNKAHRCWSIKLQSADRGGEGVERGEKEGGFVVYNEGNETMKGVVKGTGL